VFANTVNGLYNKDTNTLKLIVNNIVAPSGYAWGMVYSFWCNEELPFENLKKITNHEKVPNQLKHMELTSLPIEVFDIWPKRNPDPIENTPVKGKVPVLILSGEYDPDTPTCFAEMVLKNFPISQLIIFPKRGHIQIFPHPCAKTIVTEFLDNPEKKVDIRCLQNKIK
jgi:hypothetical protein